MEAQAAFLNDSGHCVPVFVARQAIFDAQLRIFGYELLFRNCNHGPALIEDQSSATASVIANGLSVATPQLNSRPVFINFPDELLIDGAPFALRPESCVIEILETVKPTAKLLRALKNYKEQGYILALDDYLGQPELTPLLELADIIKVDVRDKPIIEIIKLCQKLHVPGRKLLAEKVADRTTFEVAASLGIKFFQGFYFSKPVIEQGTTLRTTTLTRLRMLGELSNENYSVSQVAKIISQDPGLSFKLLQHINSPYFGFRGKVSSLSQAVALMGGKPLKQWLMLVMLAEIGEGGRHEELIFAAVSRASFLERLYLYRPLQPYSQDTFFMVGLLSNLDALLNQDMAAIVNLLPLDPVLAHALSGGDNPIRKYLELPIFLETAQWCHAENRMQELQLDKALVANLYAEAASWTIMMLSFEERKKSCPEIITA